MGQSVSTLAGDWCSFTAEAPWLGFLREELSTSHLPYSVTSTFAIWALHVLHCRDSVMPITIDEYESKTTHDSCLWLGIQYIATTLHTRLPRGLCSIDIPIGR